MRGTLDVFTCSLVVGFTHTGELLRQGSGGLEAYSPTSHRRDGRCDQRYRPPASRREGRRMCSEAPDERAAVENMATYKRKMASETSAVLR